MPDDRTPQQRSANMRAVGRKNTAPELLVRSILHRLGYRFRLHRKDLPGNPDVVFPARKAVLFVHGCFWHGHTCRRGGIPSTNVNFWANKIQGNRERDRRVQKTLRRNGWRVLTVWECELKNSRKLETRLIRFLKQPGNGTSVPQNPPDS